MEIKKSSSKITLWILFFTIIIVGGGIVYALGTWDTGYKLEKSSQEVFFKTGSSGTGYCSNVTNTNATNTYFIPTKTSAEFDSFKTNPPPGVSICCAYSGCKKLKGINCAYANCCFAENGYGYFNEIRTGGTGWSACVVLGDNGANVDCECRRKYSDGFLYCADYTATMPKRSCRVPE